MISLDAVNAATMRELGRIQDQLQKRMVILYGPDGKIVYTDLGIGADSKRPLQENLIYKAR